MSLIIMDPVPQDTSDLCVRYIFHEWNFVYFTTISENKLVFYYSKIRLYIHTVGLTED